MTAQYWKMECSYCDPVKQNNLLDAIGYSGYGIPSLPIRHLTGIYCQEEIQQSTNH
jgi:Iap family predicted aminopeptidase